MRTLGRAAAALAALGPLALGPVACTTDPDALGGPEATAGVTDDAVRIGYIGVDSGPLSQVGVAPDLGDQRAIVESVVADRNEAGGLAGRRIESRLTLIDYTAGPEAGQAACLEMTQDFDAFAVVIGPAVPRDVARCTAVTNGTLTIGGTGFDQGLYDEAEGRLVTAGSDTAMSTDRQHRGWARVLHDEGLLEGRTIGVVTDEQSPEFVAAAEDGLVPELEALGYRVAADVTLPCPEMDADCEQHEAAVQQMKDAGVDLVFMAAANLVGPTFVQAAANLDFHPAWTANGNQVTDTVARFFDSVRDEWDGAIGTSTVFAEPADLTDGARDCNRVIEERSGEAYEPGSDAFGFAAVTCLLYRTLAAAGDGVEPPAALDQDAALFPDLTVREVTQTAVAARGRPGFAAVALGLPSARRAERAARAQADDVLDFLGLDPDADRFVSELSTGTRRLVELACLLGTGAGVLCLDEPTAGIAQREAEAFGPLLLRVRRELDASMLVIEHDMPLVMSVSDRLYCLEAGAVIAAGPPEAVRSDPRVVASYLGRQAAAAGEAAAPALPSNPGGSA
ncbi:MAG TPA: ABC transporter substrate-binding protein [Acidimicrobiales bacterium]